MGSRELLSFGLATFAPTRESLASLPHDDSPSPWARGGWFVRLGNEDDVVAAIEYVNRNPLEAGLPAQEWPFVVSILK